VQLEAVRAISVADLRLEVGRQVDDVDGVEGTFLGADAAADAQAFADEGDLAFRRDFNAQFACADNGAGFLAFLEEILV
jgi:hypothetical protein